MDHIIISYKSIIVSFSDPTHSTIKLYIYIYISDTWSIRNKQTSQSGKTSWSRKATCRVASCDPRMPCGTNEGLFRSGFPSLNVYHDITILVVTGISGSLGIAPPSYTIENPLVKVSILMKTSMHSLMPNELWIWSSFGRRVETTHARLIPRETSHKSVWSIYMKHLSLLKIIGNTYFWNAGLRVMNPMVSSKKPLITAILGPPSSGNAFWFQP